MTDHCGSDLSGKKGSNSECILKLELAGFVAGLSERDSDPGGSNRNGGAEEGGVQTGGLETVGIPETLS